MKKKCDKNHLYDYNLQRCPICNKKKDVGRASADKRGYDYKWRKWRKELSKNFMYSFCWLTFLDKGKFNYDIHFHHLIKITDAPELQFEVYNVVPLSPQYHNEVEAHPERYDFKAIKKAVHQKLRKMGKTS